MLQFWFKWPFILGLSTGSLFAQAGPPERNLTKHPANDRYASYSPDGRSILFESDRSGNWDIYQMAPDGSNVRQLTRDTFADRQPSWPALQAGKPALQAGKHLAGDGILYESARNGKNELYILRLGTGAVEKAIPVPVPAGDMMFGRFHPSGRQIAFTLQESADVLHLYLYDMDTRTLEKLTQGDFRHAYPSWSPDGKYLMFFARHETGNAADQIYVRNLKTGRQRRITHRSSHDFCPAWSPDGEWIAWVSAQAEIRPEIFIMKKNGRRKQRITWNTDGDTLPAWSPDGTRLLITGFRNGNFEVIEVVLRR